MSGLIELEIIHRIGHIVNLPIGLEERLRQIIQATVEMTASDAGAIYFREGTVMVLKAVYGVEPAQIQHSWECDRAGEYHQAAGHGFDGVHQAIFSCRNPLCSGVSQHGILPVPETQPFTASLALPILDEYAACAGVIALLSLPSREYTQAESLMLATIASQVLGMVKSTQLHQQLSDKLQEQTRIYDVSKALSSTLDTDELLNLIAKTSVELTASRGCVLRLVNRDRTELDIKAAYGDVVTDPTATSRKIGEGISGTVAERETAIRIDHITPEFLETEVIKSIRHSLVCVPIIGKEGVIGTIATFDKHPDGSDHRFSVEDVNLLTAFAGQAAVAIEHTRFYERMEELALDNLLRLRELSILYHINTAMRSTVRLNKLLRIILTGVTIGGGLGFNRAILLMVNERAQSLRGMLAVGPGSGQEANQAWHENTWQQKTLVDLIVNVPDEEEYQESSFEQTAKSIWMPLSLEQGIFARTVIEKRAFNISEESDYFSESQQIVVLLEAPRFATVPLIVRDKVIGVIYVDNKYNNVPISEDDMNFLQMFANQAALAINNAMLYMNLEGRNQELQAMQDQLVQSEKMTALGKMSAAIAHEIRNPISCVGGFARRLLKDDTLPEKHRKYVKIIAEEATRLEKILQDILIFSRTSQLNLETCQVNLLLKSVLDVLTLEIHDRTITVNTDFAQDLMAIQADPQQLKQVFLNLVTNAIQQVAQKTGQIVLSTRNNAAPEGVVIEITDNGGGIAAEILDNIFNPFFTTKGSGTGLGLAITRKIVDNHHGRINVKNQPGTGVTFVINLPKDPHLGQEELTPKGGNYF